MKLGSAPGGRLPERFNEVRVLVNEVSRSDSDIQVGVSMYVVGLNVAAEALRKI